MMSIRSLALFNGGSCVVAVGWLVTAAVTTQVLNGSHDTTKSGDILLATTGDRYLATSGDFSMATDTESRAPRGLDQSGCFLRLGRHALLKICGHTPGTVGCHQRHLMAPTDPGECPERQGIVGGGSPYGSEGLGFESLQAHQRNSP